MPYVKEMYEAGMTLEVKKYYKRSYQACGRSEKRQVSSPSMMRTNQRNAMKKLRLLINSNFQKDDVHITLTYAKSKSTTEAKKELANYIRRLRYHYQKSGVTLKYISVTEYMNKNVHHHLVLNMCEDISHQRLWKNGFARIKKLDDTGNYSRLAAYLVKETNLTIWMKNSGISKRWSASQNLKQPTRTVVVVPASSWRKEPRPLKGYDLIEGSVSSWVDQWSGAISQSYMMLKRKPKGTGG